MKPDILKKIKNRWLVSLSISLGLTISLIDPALSGQRPNIKTTPVVINNDVGGQLIHRQKEIHEYWKTGREVRILGDICYSACTMYLGLDRDKVCVRRNTEFGFHGPSILGLFPAKGEQRELGVTIMAGYYPEPIKAWYIREASKKTYGYHYLKGDYLLKLGYRECSEQK
ncbi:MAG: hypothetical protein ACPGNV_11590 [Mangrovicoccus sp.]